MHPSVEKTKINVGKSRGFLYCKLWGHLSSERAHKIQDGHPKLKKSVPDSPPFLHMKILFMLHFNYWQFLRQVWKIDSNMKHHLFSDQFWKHHHIITKWQQDKFCSSCLKFLDMHITKQSHVHNSSLPKNGSGAACCSCHLH